MSRFESTEPKEFDGDIIITDPCYIIRSDNELTDDDWGMCEYGSYMEALGIRNYLTHDTIYGDWGCTVFDTNSEEELGNFCADAGLVSVFLLSDVLAYNPKFDYHKEKPWTTTLIKDFKGVVQIIVDKISGVYEEDTEYCKKGDTYEDYEAYVIGNGINKVTGEPINFVSKQTSL